jgi:hypothetical protein
MNGGDATLCMIAAIEEVGVPYMLVGSLSTNSYGIVRSTKDADIVVQLGAVSIHTIVDRLPTEIRLDP